MSAKDEEIPAEVAADSTEAVTEPTDASTAASNEVQTEPSASVEATPSVPQENSEPRHNSPVRRNSYMSDLMKASNLHCPFIWRKDLDPSMYLDHELDLMSSADEMFDDMGFRFRRYIVNLVLCYHNFYKRNITDCMKHLDELDNMMKLSSRKNNNDFLFNTINEALYHVILSCRIYILDTTEQKDKTKEILNKIKSYDAMSDANKAGLWAIRANVYVEYGYEGVKNAVSYIRKAVNIDPENAFWHFMKGMFMGRLRRMEGGQIMPENEEFLALRTAIEKREDPAFIAFAGEAYLETAKTAKRLLALKKSDKDSDKQVMNILQGLNEVAANYLKRSIELKPSSSHLLFRCGRGLINLPPPHQDIKTGLDFLRKGLEIAPHSGYGNHAMAMYLEKIEKKPHIAKEYLNVSIESHNFPAHLDMIRIEFQESRDAPKLRDELEKMLKLYKEMPRRRRILGEIVCFYLFIDYDLVEACLFMKSLIQMNSTSLDMINSHKTMILPLVSPIPLSDLVFNRIQASLNNRKLLPESQVVFAKYIQFLIDENVEPNRVRDELFENVRRQIEVGFKNKQMKPVDERVHDAQKRVRNAHEFGVDPCAQERLGYLDFYKDDLKDTKVGKTRGVGDDMMNVLHKMGQNPLPKRRFDRSGDRQEGGSSGREKGDRRRSDSRTSRERRRRRSYSSSSRSSSNYDRRSSRRRYRSSRSRRSSYSSSSSRSSSSSTDRRRSRRKDRRRSSSYDKRRNKHRETSSDAKRRRQKRSKRHHSSSSSTYSSSESSASSRTEVRRRSRNKSDSKTKVPSPPVEQLPKTDVEASVDRVAALVGSLSIDGSVSSRPSSPPAADASNTQVATNSQNGEAQLGGKVEGSDSSKKCEKRRENREDSDGSARTITSRTSGASKRSKRRSRDRSHSVRTTSSRSSKKKSRRRSSRSSSDRSSERSSRKRSDRSLTPDLIKRSDSAAARSERRSKDSGRKDDRKHRTKHGRRDASDSYSESSSRGHSTRNGKADRRSVARESNYSEDEERRQSRQEREDRDRRSKTESKQSSD